MGKKMKKAIQKKSIPKLLLGAIGLFDLILGCFTLGNICTIWRHHAFASLELEAS